MALPVWAQTTPQPARRISVCLLGDSRIAQGDWAALLPEFRVINAGVGGQKAAQIAARAEKDCSNADRIVLNAGTNDVLLCCTIASAKKAIRQLAKKPNVILTTLPQIDGREWAARYPGPLFDFQPHIAAFNHWLAGLSRAQHKKLIDFAASMDDCAECFQKDGVHFTATGYQRLAEAVREALFSVPAEKH